ncbi:hypothetical protein C8R44DRAFT_984876 [Mycena epipterygia]|nr:hypothetical protein C8R44DRAFT_984876 [Mycena epipterygia]
MFVAANQAGEPVSENARLIAALQRCFSDLIEKHDEQTDRLHRAIEALKTQAPVTDKMAFWNSYMKLADEHDKEFQQKYSTELDTALIFAGLFSAVSSAFIIQIQPQLTPNPPSNVIVVVQSLLYTSLFSTLLAALLAVQGKQWILYYQAAGSRGTIEERGLERQRKLDGLCRWKFDMVLQMFPLLLQLALLLFSTALSVYLWTVHLAIAVIVLALTSFGFVSYIFLLVSAMASPDSPFQTPLTPVLLQLIAPITRILKSAVIKLRKFTRSSSCFLDTYTLPCFSSHTFKSASSKPLDCHNDCGFSSPSAEVPAVLWILETSTDPGMIEVAAKIGLDLQWPLDLDLTVSMDRLNDMFISCFHLRTEKNMTYLLGIRSGMTSRAIAYGRIYCSLRLIARASGTYDWNRLRYHSISSELNSQDEMDNPAEFAQLINLIRIIQEWPELVHDQDSALDNQWALYVIPSLAPMLGIKKKAKHFLNHFQEDDIPRFNLLSFTNYLCCVNSFLAPINPQLAAEVDKRRFRDKLLIQLFKGLQVAPIDTPIARVIDTTAQIAGNMVEKAHSTTTWDMANLMMAMSRFCSTFHRTHGNLNVLASAASLAKIENIEDLDVVATHIHESNAPEVEVQWIYAALEHVQQSWEENRSDVGDPNKWDHTTALAIESLLQALACSGAPLEVPPLESLHIILSALSTPGNISFAAFLILYRAQTWFRDPNLQAVVQRPSVWLQLKAIALQNPDLAAWRYSEMEENADMHELMHANPCVYDGERIWT